MTAFNSGFRRHANWVGLHPSAICVILFISLAGVVFGQSASQDVHDGHQQAPLNVLLLTLDDMGYGTTGVEGCRVPEVTPHIDKLASEGIMFKHGYIMVPMCGPSRAAMHTGRYPHCSGMMGHGNQPPKSWEAPVIKTPSLSSHLHHHGYRTGAILKYKRSAYLDTWDVTYNELPYGLGFDDRNAKSFYDRTLAFMKESKSMGKPFFLYANPIDPHDPWPGTAQEKELLAENNPEHPYPGPSRKYTAEDVEVPSCLPDLPRVRQNLAPYYEALHRGDACIGSILRALEDSGMAQQTIVIFLSDNGMGVPSAKNTLYPHGVRTPIIVRWPDRIQPGRVDERSIVCGIDIMPTLLEACNLPAVEGIEGRSILNVLTGRQEIAERKHALTTFDYWADSIDEEFFPQRSIINKEFCYIWNAYVQTSGGKKVIDMPWNEIIHSGAKDDARVTQRIKQLSERPVEEFYDLAKDPGCWNNRIHDPEYQDEIARFRTTLKQEMAQSNDPQRSLFDERR